MIKPLIEIRRTLMTRSFYGPMLFSTTLLPTQNKTVPYSTQYGCNLTRHNFVENISDSFWNNWQRNFLPQTFLQQMV